MHKKLNTKFVRIFSISEKQKQSTKISIQYLVSGIATWTPENEHSHQHNQDAKKKQLNRLARATGHLNHVKLMIKNDEDVSEILIQLSAVISALNGLGKEMINEHIVHCLSHAIENGDTKAIEDLKKAIDKFI